MMAGADFDTAAIARARDALLRAVNASDVSGVVAVWADEGVLMPPHHPAVRGRAAIELYFSQLFAGRRFEFSFTGSHIRVADGLAVEQLAYTATVWSADGGAPARDTGKGIHVYRRDANGSWRLTADIWNSDGS
jgi:uncharacterized protein (TIGR02246 family)